MTRIRVLLIVWRLARSGGKPFVLRELLRTIDRDRFDVHVLSIRPLFPEDHIDELGPGLSLRSLDHEGSVSLLRRAGLLPEVWRHAREVRPDILHVQSGVAWYGLAPLMGARRPRRCLLEIHDAPQSGRRSRTNDLVERMMVTSLGFEPIVHSASVRDDLTRWTSVGPEECHLVPLGVDTGRFGSPAVPSDQVRQDLRIPADAIVVLFAGRMVPPKRPRMFVELAGKFSERADLVFVMAGTGPELEAVRADVVSQSLSRVMVLGYVEDLVSLMHSADVFVSTSDYEGFGLAVAEAMAAGLPIVSTSAGAVEEIIGDDGAGLVVDHSVDDLASALTEVLDDPFRRVERSGLAVDRARRVLDSRRATRAFEQVYAEFHDE